MEGYLDRNIRVGWLNIDSMWDARNRQGDYLGSWSFDPLYYPDPQRHIDYIRNTLGARISLWQTSMINIQSTNWQYAADNNFFLNNNTVMDWWEGRGSFVDYTNPAAVAWYHSLMKNILDMGIDGWKTDGTDPYIALLLPKPGDLFLPLPPPPIAVACLS